MLNYSSVTINSQTDWSKSHIQLTVRKNVIEKSSKPINQSDVNDTHPNDKANPRYKAQTPSSRTYLTQKIYFRGKNTVIFCTSSHVTYLNVESLYCIVHSPRHWDSLCKLQETYKIIHKKKRRHKNILFINNATKDACISLHQGESSSHYEIKNPYVILLGIVDYSAAKLSNLPKARKNLQRLNKIFREGYKYPYKKSIFILFLVI